MKHVISRTFAILVIALMTSCQTDLDIDKIIDQKSAFSLTIRTTDPETGLSTDQTEVIEVNSEKWKKLVDFAKNNKDGWQSSPASYIGDIYVGQENFRLIHTKERDGVVISFTDQEGKPRQYTKKMNKGELDFLTKKK